jgi:hypothetical protein
MYFNISQFNHRRCLLCYTGMARGELKVLTYMYGGVQRRCHHHIFYAQGMIDSHCEKSGTVASSPMAPTDDASFGELPTPEQSGSVSEFSMGVIVLLTRHRKRGGERFGRGRGEHFWWCPSLVSSCLRLYAGEQLP